MIRFLVMVMVMFNLLVCTDAEDETIEEEMETEIGL